MKVLVTGGAGLVGYECSRFFANKGWDVISVDNYTRGSIFGKEGDTKENSEILFQDLGIRNHFIDVRDEDIVPLIKDADSVIHTAAQPSHPKSIEIPMEDFLINAYGTLSLLERVRKYNKEAPFVFCSTNKVYGDAPNLFSYTKVGKRFEPLDRTIRDGFDTNLRIDRLMHTPFGVSKVAADLYTQEYASLYGMKTGVFRMGCITGGAARAVEEHNWEPYFVKKALTGGKLTIFGYDGYQVRDVIHAGDLAALFYDFIQDPRPGEVYNVGGGRDNSISLLESIDLIEEITGRTMNYELGSGREADHIWWITNLSKVKSHYTNWKLRRDLKSIFMEIYEKIAALKVSA